MRIFRIRRPSPALIISIVALLVALGGTAYAAITIPKNSVGTKQLKNGAVATKKIKNGVVTASKINTRGLTVPKALHANSANTAGSATDATNAVNATNASNASNANDLGGVSASRYQQTTLPPGQTETGAFGAAGTTGTLVYAFTGITFDPPLAAAIPFSNGVFVPQGTPSATGCPGVGQADPGFLCLYESFGFSDTFQGFGDPDGTGSGIQADGTVPLWNFSAPGWSRGSWAVTAPTSSSTASRSSHRDRETLPGRPLPRR